MISLATLWGSGSIAPGENDAATRFRQNRLRVSAEVLPPGIASHQPERAVICWSYSMKHKKCTKCHAEYPETPEFFYNRKDRDGFSSWCRKCNRAAAAIVRKDNPEAERERRRRRDAAHPERHIRWQKAHPEKMREYHDRWEASHPEAVRAHRKARQALDTGKLTHPKSCERCGKAGLLHKHHPDYSKPMEVMFVCPKCHKSLHGGIVVELRALKEE